MFFFTLLYIVPMLVNFTICFLYFRDYNYQIKIKLIDFIMVFLPFMNLIVTCQLIIILLEEFYKYLKSNFHWF